ncbi:MAG: CpsD/CapB family tyrosine-protein kinase [Chloroflexota bacterium]|nr:MAG: capsular biosynthesis protein [Chloroflexota bacterium]
MTEPNLIMLTEPRSAAAEAFRALRTNLMFSSLERPLSAIVVSAPMDAEDKSTVAANLAIAFAQAGNKTILVDGDLRKPAQHELWGVGNERGLSTMMLEDAAMSTPPLVETSVANLLLLTSGPLPPAPADMLSNQRMSDILGVLKARASYILFDSPPVLAASDAVLLGAKADGVLLVVRAGHTRRDHTARARQALERVHVNVLGAVLTNAPKENTGHYG